MAEWLGCVQQAGLTHETAGRLSRGQQSEPRLLAAAGSGMRLAQRARCASIPLVSSYAESPFAARAKRCRGCVCSQLPYRAVQPRPDSFTEQKLYPSCAPFAAHPLVALLCGLPCCQSCRVRPRASRAQPPRRLPLSTACPTTC